MQLSTSPRPAMDLDFEKPGKKARYQVGEEEEETPPTTFMERLPRDIILDILSKLPVTSLVQFRFVCRGWRMLAQDPLLPSMHLSRTAQENPCLILHCDYPIRNQLSFLDISSSDNREKETVRKLSTPFWDSMPEFEVVGSCNGLLCLADSLYKDAVYVYNPFTRDYKQLPKSMQYPDQEVVFGFGFHPMTEVYKVVKIVYYRNGYGRLSQLRRFTCSQSEVQVLTLGRSPTWRSLGKVAYQLDRWPSEALVSGRLHWVTRPKRYVTRFIASFDLADEQFREVPKPNCGGLSRSNYHLLVLKGCLSAAVYRSNGKLEIWVMKEYDVKESWIKEFSIGAHVPKGLKQDLKGLYKILGNALKGRGVRVLCQLKNGEILLEYKGRALFSFDPERRKFKDLTLNGSPNWFQAFVLVGSLNWIDTITDK